ncbi:MAG: T9SS type A sorting domain-containing protein [Flavobacteriales bacterium]|nr:T9SS type A sorting domain-containing protein [Flavobacteriales bacterium]
MMRELGVRIFPNPVNNGLLQIEGITDKVNSIDVFDMSGARVAGHIPNGSGKWQLQLSERTGTYLVIVSTDTRKYVERVVVL